MNQIRLMEAREHLYRVYKAQTMLVYYCTAAPEGAKPLGSTCVSDERIRLQQSELSTLLLLLQCLLALLLLCAGVAQTIVWIDKNGTRRVNPGTHVAIHLWHACEQAPQCFRSERFHQECSGEAIRGLRRNCALRDRT